MWGEGSQGHVLSQQQFKNHILSHHQPEDPIIPFALCFRLGFPVMVVSCTVGMCYLLLVHVVMGWN